MSNTSLDDQSRKLGGPSSQSVPEEDSIARFPIVGLGASAGGLQALKRFFEGMPVDSGMAFVVILHLSPQRESHAAAVLQDTTKMRVMQVDEAIRVEPNTVYVIPPTKYLEMEDGRIRLSEPEHLKGRLVAIDLFFRTLADTHGTYAIGVVLSGAGTDGSVGIRRVKESGGITMAQDPHEAEYDGMPRAAIATGTVDFVLPVNEIPDRLINVWRNARQIRDSKSFESFECKVVPLLFQNKAKRDQVRVWCVGCSTGEEAYSAATLLLEYTARLACPPNIKVFATDIDKDALELRCLRGQLHETVEQYQATVEEQEALNEELQAINEELRSTTEELETSKEELQSINEELGIVNQELTNKVEELSEANDDLENLMSSTDIATIFLDRFLRIKRYTPRAGELFNFIKTDVGRPLFDIRHKLNYENLQLDTVEVINELHGREREVSSQEGRSYIARLVPYRTIRDQIDGVVLSFVDITDRRQSEEALRQAHVGLELRITERTRQQQAVADLSQNALAGSNLPSLLSDAVAKVAESLRIEFCNVFEFIPNGNALLLCAGVGWKEDRIGKTTVLPGNDSLAGFTLLSNSVIIVEDLRTESRFRASSLLLEHGIISSVSTKIRGRGRAFGVLGAHSPKPRKFSEDDIHFLQAIANVLATAVERRDLEKELVDISSREQLRIGQDLHDGLCQQLAGVQYSADLIAKKMPSDLGARAEIVQVANRIREAIAQARNLARGLSLVSLESHGFMSALQELAKTTQELFRIHCRFECKRPVLINDNTMATHLYRMAQEAIHNAVKHGHAKNVLVALSNAEGNITLSIVDDGTGLMCDWAKKTGMGLRIMNYRARIIGGTFSIERAKPKGTQVICTFRL